MFSLRFRHLVAVACGWLLLAPAVMRADDFDLLRAEWRTFLVGATNLDLTNSTISNRVSTIRSNGNTQWAAMDKSTNRTFLWSDAASTNNSGHITTCYSRLKTMAMAWAATGSSLKGNTNLGADIVSGLEWMNANRYNTNKSIYDNWWDWEIGAPGALNDTAVLVYDILTPAQITNYCAAIDKFTPVVALTGANRTWKAAVVGVRGVLGKNSAKMAATRDGLSGASGVFPYVTNSDGFYTDGSFIQHTKHPYTSGYGISLFADTTKLLVWLDSSPWAVTDPQRSNVVHWAYDSYEPFLYRGAMPSHLRGREISRGGDDFSPGHSAINTMLRLAQTATPADATRLKRMIKAWALSDTTSTLTSYAAIDLIPAAQQLLADTNLLPRAELIGHYQTPSMDRAIHLRPGWAFTLSLSSSRVYNYESINTENLHGWFTGDGMTYLYNDDQAQYRDGYWATVDPYHLPGTTTDLTPRANGSGHRYLSPDPWVGGASLSTGSGAIGMAFDAWGSSLVARKSWFCFDNEIVCLGAGITCSSNNAIHTTVENRRLTNAVATFTVNGAALSTNLGWTTNLTSVSWCALAGAGGYYFPGGTAVSASRLPRTNAWSEININGSTTLLTRHYLALWFNHGVKPTNATYSYVILPNFTATQTAVYAANPGLLILENSTNAQCVRDTNLNVIAANVWNNGTYTVGGLTTDKKSSLLFQRTGTNAELAVSDPTQLNTNTIIVSTDCPALGIVSLDPGITVLQSNPVLRVAVNVNNARGRSFRVKFITGDPAPLTAAPDFARTEPGTPISINVTANDSTPLTNATLTIASAGPATQATLAFTSNSVTFIASAAFTGTNTFPYVVTDGTASATGLVTVTVATGVFPPVAVRASTWQTTYTPDNAIDADLNTRWSAQSNGQWIEFDLGSLHLVDAVSLATYVGNTRRAFFDVQLSPVQSNWFTAFAGGTSGTNLALERFDVTNRWARFVRFLGHGNSTDTNGGWNSYTEVQIETLANTAPLAVPDAASTAESAPVIVPLLANDSDPDTGPAPLTITGFSPAAHGTVTLLTNTLRFIPAAGFVGTDTVTYTLFDGGLTSTGLVTLAVPYPGSFVGYQSQVFTPTQQTNAGISGSYADPNGNGLPNVLEYALGGNPTASGTGPVPVLSSTNDWLDLTYHRRWRATDLVYAVERSTNLLTWLPPDTNLQQTVLSTNAEFETIRARSLIPVSATPGQYLRLRVTPVP